MIENYDDNSITTLDGLAHINLRVESYIPDRGFQGQLHLVQEIVDNCNDELEAVGGTNGVIELFLFKDLKNTKYQVVITDNGRGIPPGKLIDVFTSDKTSGKFNQNSYKFAAGLNGIGSTVVTGLSEYFRAITFTSNKVVDTKRFNWKNIPKTTNVTVNKGRRGSVVMFSPNTKIFSEVADFLQDQSRLVDYLSKLCLFTNYDIKFYTYDNPLPDNISDGTAKVFLNFLDSCRGYVPKFDSLSFDKESYVKSFFNLHKGFDQSMRFTHVESKMEFDMTISWLLTSNVRNNILSFVNNISFTDKASYQYSLLVEFLKRKIKKHISNNAIQIYFSKEYTLPLWLFMNVKFSGATFSGMEKHSFKDMKFKDVYRKALNGVITPEIIETYYNLIEEHIDACYNRFTNRHLKVSTSKSLLTQLNKPRNFVGCSTTERHLAELFLIEGASAKSDEGRDVEFQASYTLSGKPLNSLTNIKSLALSNQKLKQNLIFQDIIKIVNIDNDLLNLNYGKIFIATDADTHGYHIANIVIGNLYALNPRLISDGYIYIVMPPLYQIKVKKSKMSFFARDEEELNGALTYHIYYKYIEVRIKTNAYDRVLSRKELVAFSEIVNRIGEVVTSLAKETFIKPVILEQLALMTSHVDFENPDVGILSEWFGQQVRYSKEYHLLTISVGTEDIIIPLTKITDIIYEKILPLYRSCYYSRMELFATTKQTNMLNNSRISIVQLYEVFQELQKMFDIEPLKGLGSMRPKDSNETCMRKETRRTFQITKLGDIDAIFDMLGSESSERKRIIS